jgi:hypothetical protein
MLRPVIGTTSSSGTREHQPFLLGPAESVVHTYRLESFNAGGVKGGGEGKGARKKNVVGWLCSICKASAAAAAAVAAVGVVTTNLFVFARKGGVFLCVHGAHVVLFYSLL